MWPGTRASTLNQNSVSCSRLMMRTSRSAPVPSALHAEDPLPPCMRAAVLQQPRPKRCAEGRQSPVAHVLERSCLPVTLAELPQRSPLHMDVNWAPSMAARFLPWDIKLIPSDSWHKSAA